MCTISSVQALPLAPGAYGHPPMPPSEASKRSIPADIAASALNESDPARALSLLYRAALVALIHHHQAEFRQGDTEDDCLSRSQPHLSTDAQRYFADLLDAWRLTAYAAKPPSADSLRTLCQHWPRHFTSPTTTLS